MKLFLLHYRFHNKAKATSLAFLPPLWRQQKAFGTDLDLPVDDSFPMQEKQTQGNLSSVEPTIQNLQVSFITY